MLLRAYEVRKSPVHGHGIFTLERIPKGRPVYLFDPNVDTKIREGIPSPDVLHFGYISPTDGSFIVCGDDARWWNFGFPANCTEAFNPMINGEGVVYANRPILAGEELLISAETDLDAKRKLVI